MNRWRGNFLAAAAVGAGLLGPAAAAGPTLVSTNLCADQFALALAEDDQILSLSFNARDPQLSVYADKARAFPENYGRVEEIIRLEPDLVLAGPYLQAATNRRLRDLGFQVFEVPDVATVAELRALIAELGEALGHEDRAQAMTAELDRHLAELAHTRPAVERRLLVLYPLGGTPGVGSFSDEVMALAGFRNVAAERGIRRWGWLSLEGVVAAEPDVIAFNDPTPVRWSLAQRKLVHPVLRHVTSNDREPFWLTSRLWACAGPWMVEAALELRAATAEKPGRR